MYDRVESFGEINRHGHSTVRRTELVKTPCDLVDEGEEGSVGGLVMTEAIAEWGQLGGGCLSIGSRRRSRILAAGQRREMGW